MNICGKSRLAGVGLYLPPQRVGSDELLDEVNSKRFGIPSNYISRKIGIKERRVSDDHMLPSDMAIAASEMALAEADINPATIDLILFCGIDRDWQEPATAHKVQSVLKAKSAVCLDVTNACHGFMNGLSIADAFISNGSAQTVLVCTGEKPSAVMYAMLDRLKNTQNKADFRRWLGVLTPGDAGGAMVVTRKEGNSGWKWLGFWSEGEHAELCCYRHTKEGIEGQMIMGAISRTFVGMHKKYINFTYKKLGWKPEDVTTMHCHQVGAGPHKELADLARMNYISTPIIYEEFGNCKYRDSQTKTW